MWPFKKRRKEAQAQAQKAETEYEWAVQNRTTVQALVDKIKYHGEKNGIVEMIHIVAKGRP